MRLITVKAMVKKAKALGGQGSMARSSAAEYLTFMIANGQSGVEAVYVDENIWLTQKMMGELYNVETQTINYHLKKVFSDSELQENSVVRNFRITANASEAEIRKQAAQNATRIIRQDSIANLAPRRLPVRLVELIVTRPPTDVVTLVSPLRLSAIIFSMSMSIAAMVALIILTGYYWSHN